MAADFPNNPNNGDTFTSNGIHFIWDGTTWKRSSTPGVKGQKGEFEKGQKGEPGQKGQKGELGDKGQKGQDGDKGQKGELGQKGQKGQKGEGDKGQKGTTGADNSTKGDKGEQGDKGITGADNSTKGQKGEVGVGDKGQKGEEGNSGLDHRNETGNYTLVASDDQKMVIAGGNITVPQNVFTTDKAITIYAHTSSNITIIQGTGTTLRLAGTETTGNRTLSGRGLATIVCFGSNQFVVTGAGLS